MAIKAEKEECVLFLIPIYYPTVGWSYHVVEEVDNPVDRLADASDVLEHLGSALVLVDFIDGETGCGYWVADHHTHRNEDLKHSLYAVGRQYIIIRASVIRSIFIYLH